MAALVSSACMTNGIPKDPELDDAKRLFEWVLGGEGEMRG